MQILKNVNIIKYRSKMNTATSLLWFVGFSNSKNWLENKVHILRRACCQENHYFPLPVWLGSALLFNINWCCLVLDPATAPPWTCCTTVACVSKESYQCCPRGHKNCQKMMKLFTILSSKGHFTKVYLIKGGRLKILPGIRP